MSEARVSLASHSGFGVWPSVTLKKTCSMQAMAKGSISATFTAQAKTSAKISPPADHDPGISQTTAAAGASIKRNTTKASPQTISVSQAALTSIGRAFWP